MRLELKRFDIYRKLPKDLTQPTTTGAIISICSCIFICYLLLNELFDYLQLELKSEVFVQDPINYTSKIPVMINVSILNTNCKCVLMPLRLKSYLRVHSQSDSASKFFDWNIVFCTNHLDLGIDIQDDMGRHDVGFNENSEKIPIGEGDVGCNFYSAFQINKVPGNWHISTHVSGMDQPDNPDMRHIIHFMKIGTIAPPEAQGMSSSFDSLGARDESLSDGISSHDYILKIVPTVYAMADGQRYHPYQYTVAHRICAIVGGTFTVAGIIDSLVFASHEFVKKAEIGKLT